MRLRTLRLIIRPFQLADATAALDYLGDPAVMRFCEPPFDAARTQEWVGRFSAEDAPVHAVTTHAGDLVGHVIFHELGTADIYELGWVLRTDAQGQGYAAEVSRAVLDYGFVRMGLHKVAAETVAANVPARRLLERLGFRQEGLLREHTRLAGEWVDVVWYGLLANQHKPTIGLTTN